MKRYALLIVVLLTASCAKPGAGMFGIPRGGRVYSPGDVEQRPVLRGCARYSEPVSPSAVRWAITVRFVVGRDGQVNPASAVVTNGAQHSEARTDEAIAAATSCAYTPGLLKGEPVAVRMSRTFRFS